MTYPAAVEKAAEDIRAIINTAVDNDRMYNGDAVQSIIHRHIDPEVEKLVKALDAIASWPEGPIVNGSFDEPGSAACARAALQEWRKP